MVKNITFYCLQFEKSTYLCTWLWPMQGLDFLNNNNIDIQILENFLLMKSSNQNIWGALYLVAALLLSASCSDYNPDMSEGNLTKEEYEKVMEFTQNFKLRYGEIAPDNDWGFGELEVKGSRGVKGTRGMDPNKNLWFDKNTGKSTDGSVIPGMPSAIDGRYILKNRGGGTGVKMYDNYTSYDVNNQIPAGDVTDEEIIYVSHWFRTHPNPTSQAVNLRDFYVQNVSWDYDRQTYPNGEKVTHVTWLDGNNAPQYRNIEYRMNHLLCVSYGNSDNNYGNHINNMNNGNTNMADANKTYNDISDTDKTECGRLFEYRTMERYQCVDGEPNVTSFKAHSSDDNRYLTNYVLVHLEFTGPKSGLPYSGDYLAFDYSFDGPSAGASAAAIKAPDGYYSNWILKISPAYPDPEPTTETKRVMCEDLGNTYDFDFNDLVFDVYYTYKDKTNITAHITLQAVGGTLPIYIGKTNTTELHRAMLGYESYVPINVAASNGATHAPVSFTISAKSTNPNDIDIIVRNPDAKGAITDIILPKSGESNLAPQKICMPVGTRWLKENQQIEWGYTKFQDWVNNGRNTEYDVWTTGIQEDFLYK